MIDAREQTRLSKVKIKIHGKLAFKHSDILFLGKDEEKRGESQDVDVIWNKIVNSGTCHNKCMEMIRYCRVQINSLSNKSSKNLATHVTNLLYCNNVDVPYNYPETNIDIINYKRNLAKPKDIKKQANKDQMVYFQLISLINTSKTYTCKKYLEIRKS